MKKLVVFVLAIMSSLFVMGQYRSFGEFFVNKFTTEYDSINKLCADKDMMYVMNHFWSTDTLKNDNVSKRMTHLDASIIPSGFIKGYRLGDNSLIDPAEWDRLGLLNPTYPVTPTVKSKIERFGFMNPPLNMFTTYINLTGNYSGEKHIIAMVTENFPGTKYKHVMRQVMYDTVYVGEQINYSIAFKSNWSLNNCELTIIVENENKKIIGAIQVPVKSTFTTGTEDIITNTIKLYPNPTIKELNITWDKIPNVVKVINSNGQLLMVDAEIRDYNYRLNLDYPSGLYIIMIDKKAYTIVKQ